MRYCYLIIALLATLPTHAQPSKQPAFAQSPKQPTPGHNAPDTIPLGGNAWGDTVYFRLSHTGRLNIALLGSDQKIHPAESRMIRDTGYQKYILKKTQGAPAIQSLILSGPATTPPMAYVPNDKGNFFYWGRRGPSVHLNYPIDNNLDVEYFYNELTVPKGQDRIGSYFMADGFSVGYFGMQVNSPTERRILFSVWSPYTTDDPKAIPDSLRIVLIKKGPDVHAGTFGQEGAGGQSYLVYPWIAGNTYRFLLKAEPERSEPGKAAPEANSHTRFTAWFYAPEQHQWRLIACWDRPTTHSWLTRLHSFLENFEPEQGDEDRRCYYGNQWICDSAGHWTPLTRARFTGDNTARLGYRLDYSGGLHDTTFFLRNGGFFPQPTPLDTWFTRPSPRASAPPVDLADLP